MTDRPTTAERIVARLGAALTKNAEMKRLAEVATRRPIPWPTVRDLANERRGLTTALAIARDEIARERGGGDGK